MAKIRHIITTGNSSWHLVQQVEPTAAAESQGYLDIRVVVLEHVHRHRGAVPVILEVGVELLALWRHHAGEFHCFPGLQVDLARVKLQLVPPYLEIIMG